MIVDTSALVAILKREPGFESLLHAIGEEGGCLPAPVEVEFVMVAGGAAKGAEAQALLTVCRGQGLFTLPFGGDHAAIATDAYAAYGKGNGRGGLLNLLDLMVYAVASERGEPLLCTGKDYAATDLVLHPASRPW